MAVVSFILATRLLFLKKQIRNVTAQIERHVKHDTRETIKISLGDRDLEKLACQVNSVISEHKQIYINARNHEGKLKNQIADISHDLKTPLSAVKGFVQLLRGDNLTELQGEKFLEIIEQKTDVLNNLISDFFELSVIDSDDYTLNLEETDATSMVTKVLLSYYSVFAEKGQKPHIELPDHALYLMIDRIAFQRIMQNLLSNALRYAEGEIQICLKGAENGIAVFSIRNEAVSLSDEDVEHLFDRFYRADKSRTGTNAGLGLYIVKTLAEKMNARIEAELKSGWLSISISFPMVEGKKD
ncbi:MAG: HAMP domain-containing histidine kinase [Clostridia bacterium]|nr:HAMP domain-containing histidine kinase [Clostridia bacterium]